MSEVIPYALRIIKAMGAMMDVLESLTPEQRVLTARCFQFMIEEISIGRDRQAVYETITDMIIAEFKK